MEKHEALGSAVAQIERQFGKGAIMRMGDTPMTEMSSVPTGSLALDIALGIGGIPRGRIVEIFGPESSGKTTLCQHAAGVSPFPRQRIADGLGSGLGKFLGPQIVVVSGHVKSLGRFRMRCAMTSSCTSVVPA